MKSPSTKGRAMHIDCRSERGAVIPMVAIILPTLILLIALAIDAANLYRSQLRLQRAADAATFAFGYEIGGPNKDIVVERAKRSAEANLEIMGEANATVNAALLDPARLWVGGVGSVPRLFGAFHSSLGGGGSSVDTPQAHSIAVRRPSIITFVLDFSGSMNSTVTEGACQKPSTTGEDSDKPIGDCYSWREEEVKCRAIAEGNLPEGSCACPKWCKYKEIKENGEVVSREVVPTIDGANCSGVVQYCRNLEGGSRFCPVGCEPKLGQMKESVENAVSILNPGHDRLGIIGFRDGWKFKREGNSANGSILFDQAEFVYKDQYGRPLPSTFSSAEVRSWLAPLVAKGGTPIESGIKNAVTMVESFLADPNHVEYVNARKVIILFTDGSPTDGTDDGLNKFDEHGDRTSTGGGDAIECAKSDVPEILYTSRGAIPIARNLREIRLRMLNAIQEADYARFRGFEVHVVGLGTPSVPNDPDDEELPPDPEDPFEIRKNLDTNFDYLKPNVLRRLANAPPESGRTFHSFPCGLLNYHSYNDPARNALPYGNLGAAPYGVASYRPAKGEYYQTTSPTELSRIFRGLMAKFVRGEPILDELEKAISRIAHAPAGRGMSAPPPP